VIHTGKRQLVFIWREQPVIAAEPKDEETCFNKLKRKKKDKPFRSRSLASISEELLFLFLAAVGTMEVEVEIF